MEGIAALIAMLSTVVGTPQRPPQFEQEVRAVRLTDTLYILAGAGA